MNDTHHCLYNSFFVLVNSNDGITSLNLLYFYENKLNLHKYLQFVILFYSNIIIMKVGIVCVLLFYVYTKLMIWEMVNSHICAFYVRSSHFTCLLHISRDAKTVTFPK